jgi:hypothetical protein
MVELGGILLFGISCIVVEIYLLILVIIDIIKSLRNTPDMTYDEMVVFYNQTKDRTKE